MPEDLRELARWIGAAGYCCGLPDLPDLPDLYDWQAAARVWERIFPIWGWALGEG